MTTRIDAATEERLVRLAMREAAKAAKRGDAPFGAVLADAAGTPLLRAGNTQASRNDPTAHAEMNLIRLAARRLGRSTLEGLRVVTNAEPCSMCLSALVKSRVAALHFGAPHEPHIDPPIPAEEVVRRARHHVALSGGSLPPNARPRSPARELNAGCRLGEGRTRIRAWRAAVLATAAISLVVVACGETPRTPAMASPVSLATPTTTANASTEPVPAWAVDLLGQLQCADAPAPVGHERRAAPLVGHEGTASPYAWLEGIDDPDLPLDGYVIDPVTRWEDGVSHFTRHVYSVGGEVKALLLMEGTSTQGGPGSWDVTAWRACRPSEFDPADGRTSDDAPWFDAAGRATNMVHTIAGPGHCGGSRRFGWIAAATPTYAIRTACSRPRPSGRTRSCRRYRSPRSTPASTRFAGGYSRPGTATSRGWCDLTVASRHGRGRPIRRSAAPDASRGVLWRAREERIRAHRCQRA